MADVKWIKITTDMFDNRKIKHLRRLPAGNDVVLIWVMLLTMAGACNAGGMIFLTANIPYTTKMLADELGFEENTVKLALQALEELGMIIADSGCFRVANWEKYQNVDGMDKIREQTRERVARHRKKQAALMGCNDSNVTCNVTVTQSNATEEERDKESDSDSESESDSFSKKEREKKKPPYQLIADLYNDTCVSFPRVTRLSEARKKAIKARLNTYSIEDIKLVFQKAEQSRFLKGENARNWMASFDWLLKDTNMAKVLDGNYDNDEKPKKGEVNKHGNGCADAEIKQHETTTDTFRNAGLTDFDGWN